MAQLGDLVKDTISGFKGIVVAKTYWLANCVRITVAANYLQDGKPIDTQCFDEPQIEVLKAKNRPKAKILTGGDQRKQPRTGF